MCLLAKLPPTWESFVDTITLKKSHPSFDSLVTLIFDKEERRAVKTDDTGVFASKGKQAKKKEKKGASTSTKPFPPKNHAHKDLTCHYCGKKGHIAPNCYKKQRDSQAGKGKASSAENSNTKSKTKTKEKIVFPLEVEANHNTFHEVEWMVDSGATSHMKNMKHILHNQQPKELLSRMVAEDIDPQHTKALKRRERDRETERE